MVTNQQSPTNGLLAVPVNIWITSPDQTGWEICEHVILLQVKKKWELL